MIRTAIDALGWGGTCVILGVPKLGTEAAFDVSSMYINKSIMGCRYGTSQPRHDVPMLVDFYLSGQLKLDELVTRTYPPRRRQSGRPRPRSRRAQPRSLHPLIR